MASSLVGSLIKNLNTGSGGGNTKIENIITLASSGTINLTDNSVNRIAATGEVTFVLPEITDNTKFHQILIQLSMEEAQTINLNATKYFNATEPDLSQAGEYNIIYEYDGTDWVCGTIIKAEAE